MKRLPYNRKRPEVALALEKGWKYLRTSGSGHLIFAHPKGGPHLVMSHSLGGGRGERNAIAWIKKNTPQGVSA